MFYDQRANGKKKIIIWTVVFVLFIAFINFPFVRNTGLATFSRKLILNTAYPFVWTTKAVFNVAAGSFSAVFRFNSVMKENEKLKKELSEIKIKEFTFENSRVENDRLRAALGFSANRGLYLVCAKLVGRSPSNWFETIIINKGSKDGIRQENAVMNSEGIVGRVIETTAFSSKVMLLTDPDSSVSSLCYRSRDMGVIVGGAMHSLSMKYVATTADINVGDLITTSGMSSIFPSGIPIGHVSKVFMRDYDIFKKVDVKPAVNFSRLEEVFVVVR